jgi:hypothetical protein
MTSPVTSSETTDRAAPQPLTLRVRSIPSHSKHSPLQQDPSNLRTGPRPSRHDQQSRHSTNLPQQPRSRTPDPWLQRTSTPTSQAAIRASNYASARPQRSETLESGGGRGRSRAKVGRGQLRARIAWSGGGDGGGSSIVDFRGRDGMPMSRLGLRGELESRLLMGRWVEVSGVRVRCGMEGGNVGKGGQACEEGDQEEEGCG